jgi:hypothetical protein
MKTLYKIIPFFLLFAACRSVPDTVAPQNFTAQSSNGLAIGTITFEGDKPVNDIYRFFYEATAGDKKFMKRNAGKIMIKAREGNDRAFTGDFNNKKTYLFVIDREPGNYAFTQYNYLDRIGATGMVSSSEKFAIPFQIQAGTISYIGEFTYNDKAIPGTPRIVVSDNMSRDLDEFRKKFPNINWDGTLNNTVKSGNTGKGIIDFR